MILNGVKSLSYAANMQATRIAKSQGADEAVLIRPDGTVLEPPTSSVFWVSPEGELRTPALADGVLESITRDRMIKALQVEEGSWPIEDLRGAQETHQEIRRGVVAVGDHQVQKVGHRQSDALVEHVECRV